jgi:acetolactate synthase I/III small subunit
MSTHEQATAERIRVLSVEVENQPGVLFRVSGMIRRRGFNIQGLAVGPTNDPGRSRMTLAVDAGHAEVDQVEKQLDRLVEVIAIEDITDRAKQVRELVLIKLRVPSADRDGLRARVERFGGRIIDESGDQVIAEVAGEFQPVQDFIGELAPFEIVELARSGPVAMSTGR